MTDELPERSYSAFVPILIVLVAFLLSYCIQLYAVISASHTASTQLAEAKTNVPKAQAAHDRYIALVKDLVATGAKDQNAALVVKELEQAGILRQRAPASSTNAAPANP